MLSKKTARLWECCTHFTALLAIALLMTSIFTTAASAETLSTDRPDFGDYYGPNSTQFEVTGTITLAMSTDQFNNISIRNTLVEDRLLALETYMAALITDKYVDIFVNFDYGNFKSTVRHETMRAERVYESSTAGIYNIDFSVLIAGPKDLLEQTEGAFNIQMPENANGSDFGPVSAFGPLFEMRRFDPATEVGELESILGSISEIAQSPNTFPEYDRLMEDDTLDITMWAGYDYTEDRIGLWTSMRSWLVLFAAGFEMQNDADYVEFEDIDQEIYDEVVETMGIYYPGTITDLSIELFARMKRDTVFSKQVFYKDRAITVNVKIRHRNLYEGENSLLKSEFLSEVSTADILIYSGHAGPYYGWYLGPENDAFLDVNAVANITMDPDRYQIMIISGCQTYSTYSEHFFRNPAKNTNNLDVITAVNWIQLSHGERSVNSMLSFFVADTDSEYQVFSYGQLLNVPNNDVFEPDSFWATQGTNDNPVVNPLANVASFGDSCSADADCGSTPENRCTRGQCSVQSMDAYVCPEGFDFIDPYSVWGAYCAPASCPQFIFDNGQIYVDGGYAPNECSNSGLTCPSIWFYGPDEFSDAACVDGEWAAQTITIDPEEETGGETGGETEGQTGGEIEACPNTVFDNGFMYNAAVEYVSNSCSAEGQVCTTTTYFSSAAAHVNAACENGIWIDSANVGQSSGETSGETGGETGGEESEGETGGEAEGGGQTGGEIEACPNTVFDNGFIYNAAVEYVSNSCSAEGQVCTTTTYFSSAAAHVNAACENGMWINSADAGQTTGVTGGETGGEAEGETGGEESEGETGGESQMTELCPNTVFTNGYIYNGNIEYVNNSCSAEGQVCVTTSYFTSASAHLPATCEDGQWEISE